jgi:competence ComEA-like helix-hairpin-helix protein
MRRREGSILVALLWCLAILSVIVVGGLYSTSMSLTSTKNYADKIQARYIALAGAEKAKALIYHDAAARKKSAQNHSGDLYNSPENFREINFGRGQFSVIRQGTTEEGGGVVYGIRDEEGRLNINTCKIEELTRLQDMPSETAAAIIDWRDRDNSAMPGGAEREYYATLKPPYLPRNGEIQTFREMLLIRGVSPSLLLGEDLNQNGMLDPEENDADDTPPHDNRNNSLESGWSGIFSLNSLTANKNAAGQARVNVQTASESELTAVPGITTDIAKAIVAYRGQNQLENIVDLLEVAQMAPQRPNQPGQNQAGPNQQQPGRGQGQTVGPKLISEELFSNIADDVTVDRATTQKGLLNINTAPVSALSCLNGMTEELARAIVNYRSSTGYFPNIADLLKVSGMTRDIFKQIAPRITARSETFRILSEGRVASTGARERIEMIVRISGSIVDTIYYRENL